MSFELSGSDDLSSSPHRGFEYHWRTHGLPEFLGPNEEKGWELAGKAVPLLYVAWSLWLLAFGIALFV